jgi:hypothetical protein
MDEEHYIFVGDYFPVLLYGQNIINRYLQKVKVKYMSAEEKSRYQLLEAQNK